MKHTLILITILYLTVNVKGQEFDTLSHYDDKRIVISKQENQRLENHIKIHGGVMFQANYITIDSLDRIVEESLYEGSQISNEKLEIKLKKGKRNTYQISTENSYVTKEFFPSGNLLHERRRYFEADFSILEEIVYYDNKWNSPEAIRYSKRVAAKSFKNIIINNFSEFDDYSEFTFFVEQESTEPIFIATRQTKFHPNGKVKEIGDYSKRIFFGFLNEKAYEKWIKEKGEPPYRNSTELTVSARIKDGIWQYFNEHGELTLKESYIDGVLTK